MNTRILVIKDGKVMYDLNDVYNAEVRTSAFMNEGIYDSSEYYIKAYAEKMRVPAAKQDVDELAKTKDYTIDVDQV